MKKILFATFFLALFAASNAQTPIQDGPQIRKLVLMPFYQSSVSNGMHVTNRIVVEINIDKPDLASYVVIVLKERNTGDEFKNITISLIHEDGLTKYVYNNKKMVLNHNSASLLLTLGDELIETLVAEAYVIDKNGNSSLKAYFE